MNNHDKPTIAIIGLGYVGLPLAVEFGKEYPTVGFDTSGARVDAFRAHEDPMGELTRDQIVAAKYLSFTTDPSALKGADFIIVAVPTPIDDAKIPDFGPLKSASETVGQQIKKGAVVVYESTVYPGATREVCLPIIEKISGLTCGEDFFIGYSPERINPGDKTRTLTKVVKVVSADDPEILEAVASLYESIIDVGVFRATSIEVAEAAKIIENTQRDLNIALMNELSIIFDRLEIDTGDVLEAASTKWNFLKFSPGLVGGHCIGVDPYYLTRKAEMLGYHPEVILSGRRINDGMSKFVAEKTVKLMIKAGMNIHQAKVNVLGLSFKEDCRDLRNSKVPEIVSELESYGVKVAVHDPYVCKKDAKAEYGIDLMNFDDLELADALVIAVPHSYYAECGAQSLARMIKAGGCLIDVKALFKKDAFKDLVVWRM
jgi:UDP-N-acetyl-D-glucosamine/UDP-N-acetyl-D-galactosamine dehydrogenase